MLLTYRNESFYWYVGEHECEQILKQYDCISKHIELGLYRRLARFKCHTHIIIISKKCKKMSVFAFMLVEFRFSPFLT